MERVIEVPLTKGRVALVDEDDLPLIEGYKWYVNDRSRTPYAFARVYPGGAKGKKTLYMHRLILGASKGEVVDHINRDGLDNRRGNLRIATHSENLRNSKMRAHNTTGYHGVVKLIGQGKFTARVTCDGKHYYLGAFLCPVEAAIARDVAAIELHGEFASLNFPHLAEVLSPRSHQS